MTARYTVNSVVLTCDLCSHVDVFPGNGRRHINDWSRVTNPVEPDQHVCPECTQRIAQQFARKTDN